MINSVPYLIFVFFYVLLFTYSIFIQTDKYDLFKIRVFCIVLCVLFLGCRGFIGWDWYNYFVTFDEVPRITSKELWGYFGNTLMEPGFILYCSVIKFFTNNYHVLTLVNTLIDLVFLNWFLKKYLPPKYYAFGFTAYFFFGGFYFETDLLRNARSFFIFLFSIKYIEEKKTGSYYLLNLLGLFFHLSSIIYLFVYKVLNFNIKRSVFIVIVILGNILFLFRIEFVKPIILFVANLIGGRLTYLANVYFTEDVQSYGFSIGFVERNLVALMVLIYFNEIKSYNKAYNIFINSYFIYFILFFFFSEVSVLSIRFGLLFYFSYWILIPIIFDLIKSRLFKSVYLTFVISFFFLKMFGMTREINYSYENILIDNSDYYRKKVDFEEFLNKNNDKKN
ncbi:EpsG family protein [Flavobacterium sp. DGU38]|uniref:EpsG family protein n=1 Tax=Flavobacterium calami TaxID=3139144 RepID=A0ABU9IJL4_9FLAO